MTGLSGDGRRRYVWGDRSGPVRLASVVERVRGRLVAALAADRDTVLLARDARVPLLAASVAYFAFISLVPLVLLVLVAATVLGLGAISLAGVVVVVTVVVLQLSRSGGSATVLLFVGFAVVFSPLYYLFPRTDPAPLDVVPGAVVAAGTWTGFQGLFDAYVTAAPGAYDALGAVLLVLTWLYVSSLVLLVGAALNAVLSGRAATP